MSKTLPSVSVVIPARNEAGSIRHAAASALAQDYPGPLEVHIVDGASSDRTKMILAELAESDSRVTWSLNPLGDTPTSLNLGIEATTGEIVVRCDARSVLPPTYVSTAVRILGEREGAANVGGVQKASGESLFQRAVAIAVSSPFGAGDARYRYGGEPGPVDTVYLGVFRRSALEEVGAYDPRMLRNQDYELNIRLRNAGYEVYFTPELEVGYSPRASFGSLVSQYFQYGRWRRMTSRLHAGTLRLRQLAPPLLVLSLVLSVVLAFLDVPLLPAIIPGLYVVFLIVATVVSSIRTVDAAAVLLPVTLPAIHLSWGVGFLLGPPR